MESEEQAKAKLQKSPSRSAASDGGFWEEGKGRERRGEGGRKSKTTLHDDVMDFGTKKVKEGAVVKVKVEKIFGFLFGGKEEFRCNDLMGYNQ
ncbi:hypothetical protein VNO77_09632 [Canavalia gladiata]|uniref:Uncharacterized protein n=1 Tax=Canavalia gladiata TaxID=3824 RepID=A0AAN9MEX7_CANGL